MHCQKMVHCLVVGAEEQTHKKSYFRKYFKWPTTKIEVFENLALCSKPTCVVRTYTILWQYYT